MSETATIKIGGFEVIGELPGGEGGQGVIYIARCVEKQYDGVEIGDQVAIKVMTVQDNDGKLFQKLSVRTKALAELQHPGILKYYGCLSKKEVFNYYHFVIMEYLLGKTLKQKLGGLHLGLDGDEAMRICRCCLEALCYAENKNIIHRDLTPSNIFLCDNGDVKLIDFEVAKTTRPTEQTNSTGVFGKLDYMAPELFLGSKETPIQSDIFSFCLCIHEAFTGNLPYERGSVAQAKGDVKIDERLRSLVVGLDEVLLKGLANNPAERYSSFHELAEAFRPLKLTTWKGTGGRVYEALKFVGGGGFGWVYKAMLMPDKRLVAIKYLLDVRFTDRFEREAETLKQFEDDRIVQFIDYFAEAKMLGGHGFLVMNYLDNMPGSSLRDRLKKIRATKGERAGVPYEEALVAFIRYAEGLALMHQALVYHRDLKPSNLYFPEGKPHQACIMDLGVARNEEATLTHMGHVPGTLDYMPPEFARAEGGRGSVASDVYAFGLCLYEALTGRFPLPRLPAGSQAWLTYLSRSVSNPPAPEFKDELVLGNPELKALLEATIQPDLDKRLADMNEVVETLKRLLAATPGKGQAYPPSKPVKPFKSRKQTSAAPVPVEPEHEEGATEKTQALDEKTMATLAANPDELEKLKQSVREDAEARQQKAVPVPPPPKKAAPSRQEEPPAKQAKEEPLPPSPKPLPPAKPSRLGPLLKRGGIAAAILLCLGGTLYLFRKPLTGLFQKPMATVQMKKDAMALEQLLTEVETQREQMKRELESIESPAAYRAYGEKAEQMLRQMIAKAAPHMKVLESQATPELGVQYYAFSEKTNLVAELGRMASARVEEKALQLCEKIEAAYQEGDVKEAQEMEKGWNDWKACLSESASGLQSVRLRTAKAAAEQKLAAKVPKAGDQQKVEAERKAEEEKRRAEELAKAEAARKAEEERLKAERDKSTISDRQRRDLAKCDELRTAVTAAYLEGNVEKGDKQREEWNDTIKRVKDLISEQLRQNQSEDLARAREEALAKIHKAEQTQQAALISHVNQLLTKIEELYSKGTPEAMVGADVEQKNWLAFVKDKKCDSATIAAGEKRLEEARAIGRSKLAAGLVQKSVAAYKSGQVVQGDAIVNDWKGFGFTNAVELAQMMAAKRACEEHLKKDVNWGTTLKQVEEEARGALNSTQLDFVNFQVTKLAEAIAKAKAANVPVAEATQILQKLNLHRVMLASPVRVAIENPDRRVTVEYQDEAKQWQPMGRNARVSPGKVLFRFTKSGFKTITQELDVQPGKNFRVTVPGSWETSDATERKK